MSAAGKFPTVLRSLQAGRAVAALMVVFSHAGSVLALPKYLDIPYLGAPFAFGRSGVEFFFVLSGFIILWSHWDELGRKECISGYLRKRVSRIYPLYWFIFVTVYIAALSASSIRHTVPQDPWLLLKALALVPLEPRTVGGTGAPVLVVAWTLQYEIVFYVLFIAAFWRRAAGVAVLVAVVLCSIIWTSADPFPQSFLGENWILLFALGCCAAIAHRHNISFQRPGWILSFAVVVVLLLGVTEMLDLRDSWAIDPVLAYGALSFAIVVALVSLERSGITMGSNSLVQVLGAASYSIYLIHFPFISLAAKGLVGFRHCSLFAGLLLTVCLVIVSTIIGTILHLKVEKPLLSFFRTRRVSGSEVLRRDGQLP